MSRKEMVCYAFIKSIPIMCSYLFVSMAYGILMAEAGFSWLDSLLVSFTVYTGAFQFVLTTLLSAQASILTIAVTAIRHSFQMFCPSAYGHTAYPGKTSILRHIYSRYL